MNVFHHNVPIRRQGFTLVELLIVIAIIGVLASVMMPALQTAREKALIANAQSELGGLFSAMAILHDDTTYYPNGTDSYCRTTLPSDNEVDLSADTAGLVANGSTWFGWGGPYIQDAIDPWGNPYFLDEDYQCLAATLGCKGITDTGNDSSVLVSCGPNGTIVGGACDYDADNIVLRLCD